MSISKNLNEIKKGYSISSTRTLDLLYQVILCMSIYKTHDLHFNLSTYEH